MTDLRVMLDTNIVSEVMRNPNGVVGARLDQLNPAAACISILTAGELRYGAAKRGSAQLTRSVEMVLQRIAVVAFEAPADTIYGRIRNDLMRRGTPIGPIDFLIAAHALALDLTLVSANVREFSRVPDLRVENWLD